MTSKRSLRIKTRILIAFVLSLAALTVLTALAAPAQQAGIAHPEKPPVFAVPLNPTVNAQTKRSVRRVSQPSSPLFLPAVSYDLGHGLGASSVAVADVNGDGKPDLLVAAGGSSVAVLLGNGDGTFRTPVIFGSGGSNSYSVAVADVNGDGKLDLVVANQCVTGGDCSKDGAVGVLLGNGDGTFQSAVAYDSGGSDTVSVAVADVNGDGKPDVVVANCGPSGINIGCPSGGEGSVGVLLGNGDGTFRQVVTYDSGGPDAVSVAVADVNGDGKLDLVVVDECGAGCTGLAGVLLGNGDGTFGAPVTYASGGSEGASVAIADVNGDGKPDIVIANRCALSCSFLLDGVVGVLLGRGDGTFQAAVSYDSGGITADSVELADVNGDGKPDLIVTNFCEDTKCAAGAVGVLLGNGDGTFQAPVSYNSGGPWALSAAVADVNADNQPDLLVANAGRCGNSASGCVGVLLHSPTSQNSTTTTLTSTPNPSVHGQPIAFTATVTTSGPIAPTGTVNFKWGPDGIGQGTLNASGVATFTTSILKPGPYKITAVYKGDASNLTSTSTVLHQGVRY